MSTVLTKPVLLDETGQAIVGKLQDIQQAIGGTGEFIPINIRVTTPPTKTNYLAGEALDLNGIVVTLVASNGGMYDITGDCVFSPANGSTVTTSTTEVNISYTWYKDSTVFTAVQPIGIKELASIAVTTPPTQTEYFAGDELDLTGIVVTAQFDDGSTSIVTNDCVFSPADGDVLSSDDTTISISYTLGGITKTTTQIITVNALIYGVEWAGTSSSALSRTDAAAEFVNPVPYVSGATNYNSPFDNIMPWAGMVKENRTGGVCVKIPKFYYKLTQDGTKIKIQISESRLDGFHISPAHMDRGDGIGERDVVYIGRYHCANSNYKSTSGQTPKNNITLPTARLAIHNLGANIWQNDFAIRFTIWLLYIVEFADWNSQVKIGYGCGNNSAPGTMGYTDSMPYHTGTTASSRTTYGLGTQYRNIEGLWDNVTDWCDGCYYDYYGLKIILNPANFSNSSGGTLVGKPSNGVPSALTVKDTENVYPVFIPSGTTGQSAGTSYLCDDWYYDRYGVCLAIGGTYGQYYVNGLFHIAGNTETDTSATFGCRLMELPNNA